MMFPLLRGDLIMKWYQNDTIQKKGNFYFETPLFLYLLFRKVLYALLFRQTANQ